MNAPENMAAAKFFLETISKTANARKNPVQTKSGDIRSHSAKHVFLGETHILNNYFSVGRDFLHNNAAKLVDFCSFKQPAIWCQACLYAALAEKLFFVPVPLNRDLREKETLRVAALNDQPVLSNLNF